jgi:hypothetical protein
MANEYELASADVIAKYKAQTSAKPSATKVAGGPMGNEKQQAGAKKVTLQLINYAAALTGLTPEQIKLMTPAQVEQAVLQRGKRVFQGPVMGNIPIVSNIANADLTPYVMGASAGQAGVDNPVGIITDKDVTTIGMLQQPNPAYPLATQAKLIRTNLEQSKDYAPRTQQPPAGWSIKKVK